jgi:hypothetical protein
MTAAQVQDRAERIKRERVYQVKRVHGSSVLPGSHTQNVQKLLKRLHCRQYK